MNAKFHPVTDLAPSRISQDTRDLVARPLWSGYELRARLTVAAPPSGSLDCWVDVLFDAEDHDTCYALRLRELNGVRYLSLSRRADGQARTLLDMVFGYSFDVPVDLRLVVDGARIGVLVDGTAVGAVNDVHRLRHDAIGFTAHNTSATVEAVEVVRLHDDPLPSVTPAHPGDQGRPLGHAPGPHIANERYRVDFGTARRPDGETITAALSIRDGERWVAVNDEPDGLGEWFVLTGDHGDRADPHGSLSGQRLRFTELERIDDRTALLRAHPAGYEQVTLTWSLAATHPRATVAITPLADGHHVVAYHAFAGITDNTAIAEVLCGSLRHARIVGGPEAVGASELTAPLCLVESAGVTTGLFVPAEELTLADEVHKDPDDQPFGMTLRGPGGVRPTVFLPHYGRRAALAAGQTARFEVGCVAVAAPLYDTYRELLVGEYDYRAYRHNVFGASLTDTVHNLVDLLGSESGADDSVEYQGSPSGWWSRAKGFIDIENDQAVRTTTTSVLLSAAYLTADLDLYHRRARPTMEFHLSRNAYGWTPKQGYDVYADTSKHQLGATPFGVTALGALHTMTRGRSPAIGALAMRDIGADHDYWLRRAPMCVPLAAYRLTGDVAHLDRARELADDYVAAVVDTPATEPLDAHDFAIYYCADWVGLFELAEQTGERRYLDAALTEARRFVTQLFVRPVHEGRVTVPDQEVFHDRQIELSRWWDPAALFDYPRTDIDPEEVDAWLLSITGLGFEALQTYRYSGPNLNPAWAAHLLRLAHRAGDDLLRDIAHNAVVGRFTNYPGYYFRQHTVHHMKPDFPFTGPFDNTTIYHHHAPAQLGMAIDYLFAEHETRSDGAVSFPAAFEENFVWFRFRVYGHRPGRFHGEHGVWPWLPRDVVFLDNPLVDWIAGISGDRLCLSLANSSADPQRVAVRVELPVDGAVGVELITGEVRRAVPVTAPEVTVEVPGHGVVGLVVTGLRLPRVPTHLDAPPVEDTGESYHFDGGDRGLLLSRPDGAGADAYVQSTRAVPALLRYSVDGGAWCEERKDVSPAEWTVPVAGQSLRYQIVEADGTATDVVELRVPA